MTYNVLIDDMRECVLSEPNSMHNKKSILITRYSTFCSSSFTEMNYTLGTI